MKQPSLHSIVTTIRFSIVILLLVILSLVFLSFTVSNAYTGFLKQLGISEQRANDKITGGFIHGFLSTDDIIRKTFATTDKVAMVNEIAQYAKKYAASAEFKKEYEKFRLSKKPELYIPQTPEEMQKESIGLAKKGVEDIEKIYKQAAPNMKEIFAKSLEDSKKNLKMMEDPLNKGFANYKKNYSNLVSQAEASNKNALQKWEQQYPADHMQKVKSNLQIFMNETEGIDFDAELVQKNGKKYFVKPEYERKSSRWKMSFRAGREAVTTARNIVQQWIPEIK